MNVSLEYLFDFANDINSLYSIEHYRILLYFSFSHFPRNKNRQWDWEAKRFFTKNARNLYELCFSNMIEMNHEISNHLKISSQIDRVKLHSMQKWQRINFYGSTPQAVHLAYSSETNQFLQAIHLAYFVRHNHVSFTNITDLGVYSLHTVTVAFGVTKFFHINLNSFPSICPPPLALWIEKIVPFFWFNVSHYHVSTENRTL